MVRWRRQPTGPGEVIDRRGARGGRPGVGTIGVGGGAIGLILFLVITFCGGGDLADMTDILAPAGEVQTEATLDPAADPDADLPRSWRECSRTTSRCG